MTASKVWVFVLTTIVVFMLMVCNQVSSLGNPFKKHENTTDYCLQPKMIGSCRAKIPRWYFDTDKKRCVRFKYSGCSGNKNNFMTRRDCTRHCPRR